MENLLSQTVQSKTLMILRISLNGTAGALFLFGTSEAPRPQKPLPASHFLEISPLPSPELMATGVRAQDSAGPYISGPFGKQSKTFFLRLPLPPSVCPGPEKSFAGLPRTSLLFLGKGDQLIDWVLNYLAEHEEKMEPPEFFQVFPGHFFLLLLSLPFLFRSPFFQILLWGFRIYRGKFSSGL